MEEVRKKKKQPGRRKAVIKKEVRAAVRFSKVEYFIVKSKAGETGLTVSAYIRQVAIQARIKPRLTKEERQFVQQLIGMSNNLNQLAKACHQEGLLTAMLWFESYRNQLDGILEKLKP